MAHVPARLPQTEADLADWSVYADQLLAEDHPIGEPLAFELALPADPDEYQIGWFQDRWRKLCPQHDREAMSVAWALGHARVVMVRGHRPKLGGYDPIEGRTFDAATRLLQSPRGQLVETLELEVNHGQATSAVESLLRELPATCTRIVVRTALELDRLDPFLAAMPAHVTCLGLGGVPALTATHAAALASRFEIIELAHRPELAAAWLHPRFTFGEAGVVDVEGRRVETLDRATLFALQNRHGLVPIHAQVKRSLPEMHGLHRTVYRVEVAPSLVRRPDGWTLRGASDVTLDGVAVSEHEIVRIEDGSLIGMGDRVRVFVARDLDRRLRELVG